MEVEERPGAVEPEVHCCAPTTAQGELISFEENGNGAVVGDFDEHVAAELAGLGGDAMAAQEFGEAQDKRPGDFRRSGVYEGGTAALARVRVESELRDDDGLAFYIEKREVGFAFVIGEDAEVGDLFGEMGGLLFAVIRADAEEDDDATANFGNRAFIYGDAGM